MFCQKYKKVGLLLVKTEILHNPTMSITQRDTLIFVIKIIRIRAPLFFVSLLFEPLIFAHMKNAMIFVLLIFWVSNKICTHLILCVLEFH